MPDVFMRFPGGRERCLTLSYDDGVVNDFRLGELLQRKGLRCTFNLNSGMWGDRDYNDYTSTHRRMRPEQAREFYRGGWMEVAAHSVTHPHLESLPAATCTAEILKDRAALEEMFGGPVRGFAYPYGTWNDDVIASLKACGIRYARTVWSSYDFTIPKDWLVLRPTCHHEDPELPRLIEEFFKDDPRKKGPKLFYLWGHSYEFDFHDNWEIIVTFADRMAGRDDVWYATNIEVYDYVKAYESLEFDLALTTVMNPSAKQIWFTLDGKMYNVAPGETLKLYP